MPVVTRQIGPCFAAEVEGIDLTRPPIFLQFGHSPGQLQDCCPAANRDTPGPISLITVNAVSSLTPSISVRSSPTT